MIILYNMARSLNRRSRRRVRTRVKRGKKSKIWKMGNRIRGGKGPSDNFESLPHTDQIIIYTLTNMLNKQSGKLRQTFEEYLVEAANMLNKQSGTLRQEFEEYLVEAAMEHPEEKETSRSPKPPKN